VYAIYKQVMGQPQLEASWEQVKRSFRSSQIVYLLAAFALIPVNWGLEALKWKISLRRVYPLPFRAAFAAVLSGVSFSVTMPNRVGEYLGRMMYLPEGHRLRTISVTLVGSFAQLLVTIFVGTAGLFLIRNELTTAFPNSGMPYLAICYGGLLTGVLLLAVYFNVSLLSFLFRKPRWQRYNYLIEALRFFDAGMLARLLLISAVRYAVFIFQYVLVYYFFGVDVSVLTIIEVMGVVFLAMAVIPSVTLLEIGLRGEISIMLMGIFSGNSLGIGFTSITVWFINLILPAIAGSLLILNLRLFKKRNERA